MVKVLYTFVMYIMLLYVHVCVIYLQHAFETIVCVCVMCELFVKVNFLEYVFV